jgi:hypothetical protein
MIGSTTSSAVPGYEVLSRITSFPFESLFPISSDALIIAERSGVLYALKGVGTVIATTSASRITLKEYVGINRFDAIASFTLSFGMSSI